MGLLLICFLIGPPGKTRTVENWAWPGVGFIFNLDKKQSTAESPASAGDARRSSNAGLLDMKSKNSGRYSCLVQNFLNLTSRAQVREAVDTLPLLSRRGIRLKSKVIASLIQQCTSVKSIESGKLVGLHLKVTGRKRPSTFLSNNLINMYAKFGDHMKAREVFDQMSMRNLYSWNNMLSGYANLGMIRDAKRLFDKMPERDIVSWNTMVMAYVQSRWFHEALMFYMELRKLDIELNEYSFAGVLTVCVKLKELWLAKQLHCQVFVSGFLSNTVLSSSIIDAYAKCGEIRDAENLFILMERRDILAWTTLISGYGQAGDMRSARAIFNSMSEKNSVSWNALISGYSRNGMESDALKSFSEMMLLEVEPDQFTYSSCLLTCASLQSPEHGRQLHSHIITSGFRPNVAVVSSLIGMYSSCGLLEVTERVFRTAKNKHHAELWNTMISALSNHGCGKQAIETFFHMLSLGVRPDRATFLILLNACRKSGFVEDGLCLFESMNSDFGISPGEDHRACITDLLNQSGCSTERLNQLKKMPCTFDDHVSNPVVAAAELMGR